MTSRPPPLSAPAIRRSASLLPERAGPTIVAREPLPSGASAVIALTVSSLPASGSSSVGKLAGRSS